MAIAERMRNTYLSLSLSFHRQIHCKFFKRGDGLCPFGSKCFYLHVDKHGKAVQLGPPRRRQRLNARGELENFSDVLMVSVFSNEDFGRFFDEYVDSVLGQLGTHARFPFSDTISCSTTMTTSPIIPISPMKMNFASLKKTICPTTKKMPNHLNGAEDSRVATRRQERIQRLGGHTHTHEHTITIVQYACSHQ